MLGNKTWDEWIAQYGQSHQHPVNRACHTLGIPLIAASIPIGLVALAVALMGYVTWSRHSLCSY